MTSGKQSGLNWLVLGLILLVLFALLTQNTTAAIIWTDDFNDGNYDGWNVVYGVFSTDENLLRAQVGQSCINHPSTIIVGTWSFDFIFSGQISSGANIGFACEEVVLYPITGYVLKVGRSAFELVVWNESYDWIIGSYYPSHHINGRQQIDITRDETGLFRVYINSTLQIEAVDTTISASNYFHFFCGPNEALDNIRVSDSIDVILPTNTEPDVPNIPQIPGFPVLAIIFGVILAFSVKAKRTRD
ncbi:MAG: hypothetical protein ACFFBR_09125 [Promethearchaeota archaeon]